MIVKSNQDVKKAVEGLTSSFELTSINSHLRLEFCMLRADGLRAAEADVGEELVEKHDGSFLGRYLALTIGRYY